MRKILLLYIIFPFFGFGQTVESVKISKNETKLFRGQSQEIRDYYLYVDQAGIFFLASLTIPASEVDAWFVLRKDSQNVYKGMLVNGQYKMLTLRKDNEPGSPMSFYFEQKEKAEIQLISLDDGSIFVFRSI